MGIKASSQVTVIDITDAYSIVLTSEAYTFIGDTTGALPGLSCQTQVVAYCGNQPCSNVSIGTITCPAGISATVTYSDDIIATNDESGNITWVKPIVNVSDDGEGNITIENPSISSSVDEAGNVTIYKNSSSSTTFPTITFTTTDTISSSCEAIIPITIDDVTINKKFSFAVAKAGANGNGIESTEITYQAGVNGTDIPTGTWETSPPATNAEAPYLWTRTIITYTDGTASTSYSVGSTPEGIEVGGRNLFLNTGTPRKTTNAYIGEYFPASDPLIAGEQYTISLCVTPATGVTAINMYMSLGNMLNAAIAVTGTNKQIVSRQFQAKYASGYTPSDSLNNATMYLYRAPEDSTITEPTTIHWIKIEKGNKATDWTPAPEDVDISIDSVEKRVSNAETAIDQNTEAIKMTATKEEVVEVRNSLGMVSDKLNRTNTQMANMQLESNNAKLQLKQIQDDGVSKVTTETGFTFDREGMTVDSSGSLTKTQVTPDGMTVYKKNDSNESEVLAATSDGVDATNLHAKTYLIIGGRSRFENYGSDRTGCFWIGD